MAVTYTTSQIVELLESVSNWGLAIMEAISTLSLIYLATVSSSIH